jgi:hypothetical protein
MQMKKGNRTRRAAMIYFPELKVIVDASMQSITRSKDKRKRKIHYSVKKKRHTVKTHIR